MFARPYRLSYRTLTTTKSWFVSGQSFALGMSRSDIVDYHNGWAELRVHKSRSGERVVYDRLNRYRTSKCRRSAVIPVMGALRPPIAVVLVDDHVVRFAQSC